MALDEDVFELLAPPHVAADRKRTQRIAVVALAPGDEILALILAGFLEILLGQLERGLDRLGAAGDVVDLADPLGRRIDQQRGQRLGRLVGEKGRVRIGQLIDLLLDRLDHLRMAVPKAGHGGTATGVDIALAGGVDQIDPLAADGERHFGAWIAVEYFSHLKFSRSRPGASPLPGRFHSGGSDPTGDRSGSPSLRSFSRNADSLVSLRAAAAATSFASRPVQS